jgi:hypothetical protein
MGSWFRPDAVASVTDGTEKLLATRGSASDCLASAAPGGFTYMTYTVTANVATPPNVSLQGFRYDGAAFGPIYFPTISSVQFKTDSAAHRVTVNGTLTNTSSVVLGSADVCAGVYDASGVVRGVGAASVDLPASGLAAGASAPFTVVMDDPGGIVSAKAIGNGNRP